MEVRKFYIGLLAILLPFFLGCSPWCAPASDTPTSPHNITLILQCNGSGTVPLLLEGQPFLNTRDLAASNCSAHVAGRSLTIMCPRAEIPASVPAARARRLLKEFSGE